MTNILKAILNISKKNDFKIKKFYKEKNRANNMGDSLELFIKDSFASTFDELDESKRIKTHSECFSFLGNKNNPPDLILKDGDAVEVKKVNNRNTQIQLNSSYPKETLRSDNPLITKDCKNCENWTEKDLIYSIGHTDKLSENLTSLWLIYGRIYCAKSEIYSRIKENISKTIENHSELNYHKTKELAKIKKVDPLGITDLRVRGMWTIQNPRNVFNYIYKENTEKNFQLVSIIPKNKFNNFSQDDIKSLVASRNISISDVQIKDPNNPAKLIPSKFILFIND